MYWLFKCCFSVAMVESVMEDGACLTVLLYHGNLFFRKLRKDGYCERCQVNNEDIVHALWQFGKQHSF